MSLSVQPILLPKIELNWKSITEMNILIMNLKKKDNGEKGILSQRVEGQVKLET